MALPGINLSVCTVLCLTHPHEMMFFFLSLCHSLSLSLSLSLALSFSASLSQYLSLWLSLSLSTSPLSNQI